MPSASNQKIKSSHHMNNNEESPFTRIVYIARILSFLQVDTVNDLRLLLQCLRLNHAFHEALTSGYCHELWAHIGNQLSNSNISNNTTGFRRCCNSDLFDNFLVPLVLGFIPPSLRSQGPLFVLQQCISHGGLDISRVIRFVEPLSSNNSNDKSTNDDSNNSNNSNNTPATGLHRTTLLRLAVAPQRQHAVLRRPEERSSRRNVNDDRSAPAPSVLSACLDVVQVILDSSPQSQRLDFPLVEDEGENNSRKNVDYAPDYNKLGTTPLVAIIVAKEHDVLRLILTTERYRSRVDIEAECGKAGLLITPLGAAICKFDVESVKLLLAAGADFKRKGFCGTISRERPLDVIVSRSAIQCNRSEVAKIARALVLAGDNFMERTDKDNVFGCPLQHAINSAVPVATAMIEAATSLRVAASATSGKCCYDDLTEQLDQMFATCRARRPHVFSNGSLQPLVYYAVDQQAPRFLQALLYAGTDPNRSGPLVVPIVYAIHFATSYIESPRPHRVAADNLEELEEIRCEQLPGHPSCHPSLMCFEILIRDKRTMVREVVEAVRLLSGALPENKPVLRAFAEHAGRRDVVELIDSR